MARRTREEILAAVLDACLDESSKTGIVFQTNMNSRSVIPYIEILVKRGFMEIIDGKPLRYKITEKGVQILNSLRTIRKELE